MELIERISLIGQIYNKISKLELREKVNSACKNKSSAEIQAEILTQIGYKRDVINGEQKHGVEAQTILLKDNHTKTILLLEKLLEKRIAFEKQQEIDLQIQEKENQLRIASHEWHDTIAKKNEWAASWEVKISQLKNNVAIIKRELNELKYQLKQPIVVEEPMDAIKKYWSTND